MSKLSTIGLVDLRVDGIPSLAELMSREGVVYKMFVDGQSFMRLRDNGVMKPFVMRFDPSCHLLHAGKKRVIDVSHLKEVRLGFLTQTFLSFCDKLELADKTCFSLVYSSSDDASLVTPIVINLICPSEEKRDLWAHGLSLLLQNFHSMNGEAYSLSQPWLNSLKKGCDYMEWRAAKQLLQSLNVSVGKKPTKFRWDKTKRIYFSDFVQLIRKIRAHSVVTYLFSTYAGKSDVMSAEALRQFFEVEQMQMISLEESQRIIEQFCMTGASGGGNRVGVIMGMDEMGFQNMMITHTLNGCWDVQRESFREHEMTQPMANYFINSSHNTYLSGHQLNSLSSIEMYIRALRLGCRSVEIDIWDGPNGEPIVYHGYTLTSKILLRDVLRVVKSHGFRTNPYPIVLSFENHCSRQQQVMIAKFCREILGDSLARFKTSAGNALPSPEALKKKVLIKGTLKIARQTEVFEEDLEDLDLEKLSGTLSKEELSVVAENLKQAQAMAESSAGVANAVETKVVPELEDITYLRSKKLPRFPDGYDDFGPNTMTSLAETRANKLLNSKSGFQGWRKFNSQHFSRVFPRGSRFDSSNFDPILYWHAGSQMVALNFQTSSAAPMLINWAKFHENGACGYVLRPPHVTEVVPPPEKSSSSFFGKNKGEKFRRPESSCSSLRVQIFGGRLFHRPNISVAVHLYDGSPREVTARSKPSEDPAGFCPDFEFDETFPVVDSVNTYVTFTVYSKDTDFAYYCVPLEAIRHGYRVVPLLNSDLEPLAKGMCHLLCRFEKKK